MLEKITLPQCRTQVGIESSYQTKGMLRIIRGREKSALVRTHGTKFKGKSLAGFREISAQCSTDRDSTNHISSTDLIRCCF